MCPVLTSLTISCVKNIRIEANILVYQNEENFPQLDELDELDRITQA